MSYWGLVIWEDGRIISQLIYLKLLLIKYTAIIVFHYLIFLIIFHNLIPSISIIIQILQTNLTEQAIFIDDDCLRLLKKTANTTTPIFLLPNLHFQIFKLLNHKELLTFI